MEGACVCDTSPPPILRLRGLCPHSVIDSLFLPMNLDKDISSIVYRGNIHSFIRCAEYIPPKKFSLVIRFSRFNSSSHMWEMSMVGSSESTVARSIATLETYLLGRYSFVMIAFLPMTRTSINIITTIVSIITIILSINISITTSVSISVSSSAWQSSSPPGRTGQSRGTTYICL